MPSANIKEWLDKDGITPTFFLVMPNIAIAYKQSICLLYTSGLVCRVRLEMRISPYLHIGRGIVNAVSYTHLTGVMKVIDCL